MVRSITTKTVSLFSATEMAEFLDWVRTEHGEKVAGMCEKLAQQPENRELNEFEILVRAKAQCDQDSHERTRELLQTRFSSD